MGVRNRDAKEGKDGQRKEGGEGKPRRGGLRKLKERLEAARMGRDGENSSGRVWGRLTRTGREEEREGAALERGGRGERDGKGNKKGGE